MKESLLDLLQNLRAGSVENDEATLRLRHIILREGSNTEDNANCLAHIEIGPGVAIAGEAIPNGPRLRGRGVMVSDVLGWAEEAKVPAAVVQYLPSVTQAEWEACIRLVVHILLAAEHTRPVPG